MAPNLEGLQQINHKLAVGPLDPINVLARATFYLDLDYPELAAADAYVALTLVDAMEDEDEIDDDALLPECVGENNEIVPWPATADEDERTKNLHRTKITAIRILVDALIDVGCLRDAWKYYQMLVDLLNLLSEASPDQHKCWKSELSLLYQKLSKKIMKHNHGLNSNEDPKVIALKLPHIGFARREIYPWNNHEPDRTSAENIHYMNEKLKEVAPLLEVRATELPDLTASTSSSEAIVNGNVDANIHESLKNPQPLLQQTEQASKSSTTIQLGLFARTPLHPNSTILREKSILTAIRDAEASLCDACTGPLGELDSPHAPVACDECHVAVFCGEECKKLALEGYHGRPGSSDQEGVDDQQEQNWPFCTNTPDGLTDVGRDPNSTTPSDDLYFLLWTRSVMMAERQGKHPLDLEEVRWLWGSFQPGSRTLPWTLKHNVILPLTFFTLLSTSSSPHFRPYSSTWLTKYDFWIHDTLLAKFRSVASARQSRWDGKPEAAAVHWRWCLANHSCAPNVRWTWPSPRDSAGREEGDIQLRVRDQPVWRDERQGEWTGVPAGEEILNHYCDVTLSVEERREWAAGALGGRCRCVRCLAEEGGE